MSTEWRMKRLIDICDVFADGDWIEKKDQSKEGVRLIQTGNIGKGCFLDKKEKTRYITDGTFIGLRCTEVLPGDCLVSRLPDPVGRASIIPNSGQKMITAVDCTIMRFKKDVLLKWFIYYSLSPKYQSKINSGITGATRQRISRSNLANVEIPVPPKEEQKRLVNLLDEVFEKIDKAKENVEKNLQNVRELFESYLQDILANPGDGWEEKRVKEVCELKSGTTISKSLERNEGDVLYVKVGDMNLSENLVEINTSSRFVKSNEIKMSQIIPEGSIIFPKRGGAIATNKKRKIVKPTIVDLNTMAIIPGKKIDKDYFFHWFQLFDLKDISNGANIPQINNYSFDEVYIPYPVSLNEQAIMVKKLDALLLETEMLEAVYQKKLVDLEELKKSILQKAFEDKLTGAQA